MATGSRKEGNKPVKIPYERRKSLVGFLCICPWLVGFLLLYLYPMVQSMRYTFSDITFQAGSLDLAFAGMKNYKEAFFGDPTFVRTLSSTLMDMLYQVPTILVFSMIIALLLNHKFRGRTLMRAIFFLPVIIATGVVMDIINNDLVSMVMLSDAGGSNMFQVDAFKSMLEEMGVDESIGSFVITTANNVFDLSWRSGIQILLFLAGLQSIPGQLYEAASMDGCTAWERYWKVTFPLLGPVLIINLVYTIIDHFTSLDNAVMKSIMTYSKDLKYAYSSTLAWIYFACVIVILLVVALLARRRISYQEL